MSADAHNAGMTAQNQGRWDVNTQTFHGGQDWRGLSNFTADFSTTCNGLGTPTSALEAARKACDVIEHYPASDMEPVISEFAEWLWPGQAAEYKPLTLFGNGASELIDLVIRDATVEPDAIAAAKGSFAWRPGPQRTQYKEYSRSATAAGFATHESDNHSGQLLCMVNPTNPTGDWWPLEEVQAFLEKTCSRGTTVIVDESMLPWHPKWREQSLMCARDWCRKLSEEKGIHVWAMTSWTKIWSCPGIRLGTVVAPTAERQKRVKAKQVPWSVNCCALAFFSAAMKDDAYIADTHRLTKEWNVASRTAIEAAFPAWKCNGHDFLSWLWVETGDAAITAEAVRLAKAAGVPVRSGQPGYNMPTFFRIAVKDQKLTAALIAAWAPLKADKRTAAKVMSPAKKQRLG